MSTSNRNSRSFEGHVSATSSASSTYSSLAEPQQKSRLAKIKNKVKKLVTHGVEHAVVDSRVQDPSLAITREDPAFRPDIAAELELEQGSKTTTVQKMKIAVRSAGTALVNPKEAAKQVAARQMSSMHHPLSMPANDKALLEAYDDCDSESSTSSNDNVAKRHTRHRLRIRQRSHLEQLESQRESRHVAWTLDHVDRVKAVVVPPFPFPNRKDFVMIDANGQRRPDNLLWLGQLALWYTKDFTAQYTDSFENLPFSIDALRKHAERLILASAPMQVWAMEIRSIYRWENPKRTGTWLAIWLCIWYFEYVVSFFCACLLYYIIKNKLNPRSKDHLRASLERALDRDGVAFQFGELIDRYGTDDWVAPFLDQMGPYIQLQINDLADYLEILTNFCMWRSPSKTWASLAFVVSCMAISALTDTQFASKVFWFIVGNTFFFCWPIASRYPRYRLLVSGFRWTLWNIPTNAEWGFAYLKQKCEKVRETAETTITDQHQENSIVQSTTKQPKGFPREDGDDNSSADDGFVSADSSVGLPPDLQFLSFRCRFQSTRGRLTLTPEGLHFIRSINSKRLWTLKYEDIDEIRKYHKSDPGGTSKSPSKRKDTSTVLELQSKDDRAYPLDFKNSRDEAFNYIIGFSRVQWKSLQS